MSADQEVPVPDEPAKKTAAKKTAAKKTAAKKTAAKKTAAKKTAAKETTAKKTATKKAPTQKTAVTAPVEKTVATEPPEGTPAPAAAAGLAGTVVREARTLGRLVAAYRSGDYRQVPATKVALMAAGIAYVASPLDLVPDFLPVGWLDDALVAGLVLRALKTEIDAFGRWEQSRADA